MASYMSPAGSTDDVFISRPAAGAAPRMDLLRVDRYESLQTPRPAPPPLTATSPRRRSEPFDLGPFSLSGDSSPLEEYPSRPVSSAMTQLSAAGGGRGSGGLLVGGGYMSDSSTSKKLRKVKQNTLTLSTDKRRSKSPIERAAAAAASNSGQFVVHRSTSIIAGTSRSTSYEEELEERLDNVRVGASLWQQRAAMERSKRLALAEQLAEQEHCYRTMMENFREQEEQKYERLKNRARVLMRRSEHLRSEKVQLEAKLAQAMEKSVGDRKTFENRISNLTEEVERLKETNEAKRVLEAKALIARRKSEDSDEWLDQYKRLFEIALKRIQHLEQFHCAQDGHSPNALSPNAIRNTVKRFYSATGSCRAKRRSSSCPAVMPSAGGVSPKLQFRPPLHADNKQSLDQCVGEFSNSKKFDRAEKNAENANNLNEVSQTIASSRDASSNDKDLKRNVEQTNSLLKENEVIKSVPTSTGLPVRSVRPMSLNDCRAPAVTDLSSKHTAFIRKWYSEAWASSSSSRKLTNKNLDSPERTSVVDRKFKPRRIVSTSRMELFRKLPNFGPGLETLECGARLGIEEFKPDSFLQRKLVSKTEGETDNDIQGCIPRDSSVSTFVSGGDEVDGFEVGCAGRGETNEEISLHDDALSEFHDTRDLTDMKQGHYDQREDAPERGHSSFDRLRHRRNGLTSARNFQIKPAASCSRLDQIAKSIKTCLN